MRWSATLRLALSKSWVRTSTAVALLRSWAVRLVCWASTVVRLLGSDSEATAGAKPAMAVMLVAASRAATVLRPNRVVLSMTMLSKRWNAEKVGHTPRIRAVQGVTEPNGAFLRDRRDSAGVRCLEA